MAEYKEGMGGAKKIIALLIVLALLIGAFFGVKALNTKQEETEKGTKMMSLDPKDIDSIYYTLEGAEFSIVRGEKGEWVYEQDPSMTLDQDAVDSMLETAGDIYAETVVSENLDDLSKYGLEKPSFILEVTQKDGSEHGYYEGIENSMNSVTYACMKDDDRIFAVASSVSGSFRPANELLASTEEELSE